jgi:hypothetical protein
MALNPPILSSGLPAALLGEYFLLSRECSFRVDTHVPEFKVLESNAGVVFMTSIRLVFIANNHKLSFEMPIEGIVMDEFKQPILGANYLHLHVAPVPNRGINTNIPFDIKLTFRKGTGTFLHVFYKLRESYLASEAQRVAFLHQQALEQFIANTQVAFVDSSDPSILYVTQPAVMVANPVAPQAYYAPEGAQVSVGMPVEQPHRLQPATVAVAYPVVAPSAPPANPFTGQSR